MLLNAVSQTDLLILSVVVVDFGLLESFEPIEVKDITILVHSDFKLAIVELDVLELDQLHEVLGVDEFFLIEEDFAIIHDLLPFQVELQGRVSDHLLQKSLVLSTVVIGITDDSRPVGPIE